MIDLISDGQIYSLDDGDLCEFFGLDNAGMPPVRRFAQRGPMQHGTTLKGYRLSERNLRLYIGLFVKNQTDYWSKRDRIIDLFSPDANPSLQITKPDGTIRRIDCAYADSLSLPIQEKWKLQKLAIDLIAPEPSFYDPVGHTVNFAIGAGGGVFAVPTPVPTAVGVSVLNQSLAIDYPGTWNEYPVILITGPLADFYMLNNLTGEILALTGYTVAAGHSVEIDTRFDRGTVTLDGVTNLIDALTENSDLATFHIEHKKAGELYRTNSLSVTGSGVNTASAVQVSYFNRYIAL